MESIKELVNVTPSFINGQFFDDNVKLFIKDNEITFPISNIESQKLMDIANVAPFGMNEESIVNEEYRKAYIIDQSKYAINFDVNKYDIIDKIQNILAHDDSIKLVYDKLNIYGVGGHFKTHKDTPRTPLMIGSLVICFPSEFSGGDFVLHESRYKNEFPFQRLSKTHFQWIAFYGDIDHEVLPVVSGNRITLTYNIMKIDYDNNKIKNSNEHVKREFNNLLNNPTFYPDGVTMGYSCKYMYSGPESNIILKGSDIVIYNTLKELHMNPRISNIVLDEEEEEEDCLLYDDNIKECDICSGRATDKTFFMYEKNKEYESTQDYEDSMDESSNDSTNSILIKRYAKRCNFICNICANKDIGLGCIKIKKMLLCIPPIYGPKFLNIYTAPENMEYVEAQNKKEMMEIFGERVNIVWLNDPNRGDKVLALEADIFYGNDPTMKEQIYKYCIFSFDILPYNERII